jgi:protein TonB
VVALIALSTIDRPVPVSDGMTVGGAMSMLLHGAVLAAVLLAWPSVMPPPAAVPVTLLVEPSAGAPAPAPQSSPTPSTAAARPEPAAAASTDVPQSAPAAIELTAPSTQEPLVSMAADIPVLPAVVDPPVAPAPKPPRKQRQQPAASNASAAMEPPAIDASAAAAAPSEIAAVVPAAAAVAAPRDPVVVLNARFATPPAPPMYPPRARELSQQGEVVVRALVRRRGVPDETVLWRSSGFRLLDQAALHAVRGWQFEAAQVPVRFELKG